jgi:hypothetical protein
VDLAGHGSNHDLGARLDAVTRGVAALEPTDAIGNASTATRSTRKRRRPGDVEAAILSALGSATELRFRDIHAAAEALLGEPVAASSVKNWLARAASRPSSVVERTERGRYRLRERSRE